MKAVKHGVELQIPALGVTQVKQAGLQSQALGAHQQLERTGVVLHLGPGLIGHPLTTLRTRTDDAQIPQPPRQGRVFDRDPVLFPELLHHPLGVAFTLLVQLAQPVRIQHDSRRANGRRHLPGLGDDPPHGIAT
jgi:hypothetical protein